MSILKKGMFGFLPSTEMKEYSTDRMYLWA